MKEIHQVMTRNCTEYIRLDKTIRDKCEEAKDEWSNGKCAEIEKLKQMVYTEYKQKDQRNIRTENTFFIRMNKI